MDVLDVLRASDRILARGDSRRVDRYENGHHVLKTLVPLPIGIMNLLDDLSIAANVKIWKTYTTFSFPVTEGKRISIFQRAAYSRKVFEFH
jgi:hypothetical protein